MVQITFKTLSQEAFKLEFELTDTIATVKDKIAEVRGDAAEHQKLLYNGKILSDDTTIEAAGYDPVRFFVVMVKKPSVSPPPSASAPAATPAAEAAPAAAPSDAAPEPALTEEQETKVQAIMSMGFPRDSAIVALQAANFNPDAAFDFLMGEAGGRSRPNARAADLAPGVIQAASGQRADNPAIAALRSLPSYDEIRRMVRQNPALLPDVLAQVGHDHPGLMEVLASCDHAEIAAILNEPDGVATGADPEADLRTRGVARINVTPQDNAAIERLQAMGFPEALAVEAYFACDKSEDLAVNYILQRMNEAADAFNE